MHVHVWRDDIAPSQYRWHATAQEYDLGVPVGAGAAPLKAIADLLWMIDIEDIDPRQCSIVWEG
jgi:hypothetical protein